LLAAVRGWKGQLDWRSLAATGLWFAIPFVYVLWQRPPMYDGFRHFLFILPPVFALGGIAMDAMLTWLRGPALRLAVVAVLIAPGLLAGLRLHPYEYTYYNLFAGGTDQASYNFETDYWLTCYKEALHEFDPRGRRRETIVVPREGYLARFYAKEGVRVVDASYGPHPLQPGEYVLVTSRANPSMQKYRKEREFILIERDNAVFCAIEKHTE
jgi:hypothetical protein